MALCTLHPSLTALIHNLEAKEQLTVSAEDNSSELGGSGELIQDSKLLFSLSLIAKQAPESLSTPSYLAALKPEDTLLYSEHFLDSASLRMTEELLAGLGNLAPVKVAPKTVSEMLQFWEELGKKLGKASRARDLAQRVESQILDWTSNFYARMKGKRVLILSSFSPVVAASAWISDIIRKIGAIAPELDAEADQVVIDWNFIKTFDPHCIILAPLGSSLEQCKKLFFEIEKMSPKDKEAYESTSAAKRGEIYFAEGTGSFYSMDYRILKTLAVVVSAAAGFESGYISDRDTFFKLRYLELHRHKI